MAGIMNAVYTVAAVAVAVLGLLFVIFGTGERDRGLLVGGAVSIVLLLGLGAVFLM